MALLPDSKLKDAPFWHKSTFFVEAQSYVFPFVSALTVYDGVHKLTGNLVWGVVTSVVAFLFAAGFYRLLIVEYPRANPTKRHRLIPAMFVFGIFAICLTTPFSVASLGGDIALRENMNGTIKEGDRRVNERLDILRQEQSLGGSLGQYALQFKDLAKQEEAGAFTGVTGRGSAAATFDTVGQTLTRMEAQVTANQQKIDTFKTQGTEILTGLRSITYDRTSQQDKQARFAAGLADLNDLLSQMDAASVVPTVQQAAGSLNSVASLQVSDSGTEVGARQSQAIGKAQELVSRAQADIDKAATSVKAASGKRMEPLTVIDQGKAIFVYWWTIVWAWALALTLDFAPMLFMFVLAAIKDIGGGKPTRKKTTATDTGAIVRTIRGGR